MQPRTINGQLQERDTQMPTTSSTSTLTEGVRARNTTWSWGYSRGNCFDRVGFHPIPLVQEFLNDRLIKVPLRTRFSGQLLITKNNKEITFLKISIHRLYIDQTTITR